MKLSEAAIKYANENCNGKIMPKTWRMIYDSYMAGAVFSSQRNKELEEGISEINKLIFNEFDVATIFNEDTVGKSCNVLYDKIEQLIKKNNEKNN